MSLLALNQAIRAGDRPQLHRLVLTELPADLLAGPAAPAYALARTERLLGSPGVAEVIDGLARDVPVTDRSLLGSVTAQVLVLGQQGMPCTRHGWPVTSTPLFRTPAWNC